MRFIILVLAAISLPLPAAQDPGYTFFVAPHSHIDLEWYWTLEQARIYSGRILTQALRMFRDDPRFSFTQDQRLLLEPFWQELAPEDRALLRRMAAAGRFEAVGGMDAQPDVNFSSFEALSRQFLPAAQWMEETFGSSVQTAWNIDTFGHTVQMPQLFRKAGLRYAVFTRGVSAEQQKALRNPFYWESPDGSRVLTFWLPTGYAAGGRGLGKTLRALVDQTRRDERRVLLLWGNDLYFPNQTTAEMERRIRAAAAEEHIPVAGIVFGTPRTYFQAVEAGARPIPSCPCDFNPAVNLQDLRGLYAERPRVKLLNRSAENALAGAETLSALAFTGGLPYPAGRLSEAWGRVLLNQSHDAIAGSHSDAVYNLVLGRYQAAVATAGDSMESAGARITREVDTSRGGEFPFLVWNTLSFERTEVVRYAPVFKERIRGFRLFTANGTPVPFRVVGAYRRGGSGRLSMAVIEFVAENVPGLGYQLYRIEPADDLPVPAPWVPASGAIASSRFLVRTEGGSLSGIRDRETGVELFDTSRYAVNELVFAQENGPDLEGMLALTGKELRADGASTLHVRRDALGTTLRTEAPHLGGRRIQEVELHERLPRIDFTTRLTGFPGGDGILSAVLPFAGGAPFRQYDDTHGVVIDRPDGIYNAGDWTGLQYPDRGVALLNQGTGGHQIERGMVRLFLLRSITDYDKYDAPLASEAGDHTFRYSLYPHAGRWKDHAVVRQARSFNTPLHTIAADVHPGPLPPRHSFVQVHTDGFEITALKKAESNDDLILRGREIQGEPARVRITLNLPVERAWTADLRERPLGGVPLSAGVIEQDCRPFAVLTFRLKIKRN